MAKKSSRLPEETPNLPNEHIIQNAIASLGMTNDEIMVVLYRRQLNVDCIVDGVVKDPATGKGLTRAEALEFYGLDEPSEADRVSYCERQIQTSSNATQAKQTWGSFFRGGKMVKKNLPEYFKLRHQRLSEQVRRARHQEQKRREKAEGQTTFSTGTGGSIHDIGKRAVGRYTTGIPELDKMFGANTGTKDYGIPVGTVTIFGGEFGVGKTRTNSCLAAQMSRPVDVGGQGRRVLIQQNEMDLDIFNTNYLDGYIQGDEDLWLYNDTTLASQLDRLYEVQPAVAIVDSYQMIQEANHAAGAARVIARMRQVAAEIDCAIILISQLNAAGEIKGGTKIPHMVDVVLVAKKMVNPRQFTISCPKKNRFGPTGGNACFEHADSGIIPFRPGSHSLMSGRRQTATVRRPARGSRIVVPRQDAQATVEAEE